MKSHQKIGPDLRPFREMFEDRLGKHIGNVIDGIEELSKVSVISRSGLLYPTPEAIKPAFDRNMSWLAFPFAGDGKLFEKGELLEQFTHVIAIVGDMGMNEDYAVFWLRKEQLLDDWVVCGAYWNVSCMAEFLGYMRLDLATVDDDASSFRSLCPVLARVLLETQCQEPESLDPSEDDEVSESYDDTEAAAAPTEAENTTLGKVAELVEGSETDIKL